MTEEEGDWWQRVVRGVRENPRKNRRREEANEKANEGAREEGDRNEPIKKEVVAGGRIERVVGVGAGGRGLDGRSARRLRKGEMVVERRIDLHGLSRVEARKILCGELRRCYAGGMRCVLVISGKGQGVLREEVVAILEGRGDIVLGHYEAKMRDGGEGARYVLLRRQRGR